MDNICHTLAGAALGEAGLKTRTRFGNATLMVAANLPDVDVLVFATSLPSVFVRRGWTHGILAQALLPIALVLVLLVVDRLRPRRDAGRAARDPGSDAPPCRAGWMLVLAYVGVYSHVGLDFLNNYGVRLLAPADWRWFYGDAVFIVDIWLWFALAAGVRWARTRRSPRPARIALGVAAAYVAIMLVVASAARARVAEAWQAQAGPVDLSSPRALMVGPVPIDPFARTVILDAGDRYVTGSFRWPRTVRFDPPMPKADDRPEVEAARRDARIRQVLVWARFPTWTVERRDGAALVHLGDLRFGGRPGLGTTVTVPDGVARPGR